MTMPEPAGEHDAADAQAFLGGAVRDALGLTDEDLRIALRIGRIAVDRGAFGDAFRTYATILICAPADLEAQLGLSVCALELGDASLALQAASAAVALAPRDARGYLVSGRACLALGRPVEAVEDLADAVRFGLEGPFPKVVEDARRLMAVGARPTVAGPG